MSPVRSVAMEPEDEGQEDEGPVSSWLDPDDRLWRHPSEVAEVPFPAALAPPTTAVGDGPGSRRQPHLWAVAVLAGSIGAVLATGLLTASGRLRGGATTVVRPVEQIMAPGPTSVIPIGTSAGSGVVAAVQRLRPAVFEVEVEGDRGHLSGSGVVFRTDGHILTDPHLVSGASTIVVVTADGRRMEARLVGSDPETGVAVVKFAMAPGSAAPVAPLGSARDVKVGQPVMAMGSPLGLAGGPSVAVGVISALGREVDPDDGGPPLLDMIQTDAPIAPGSSGGALVDASGAVIGITSAVGRAGTEGLGYAVPIDIARDAAQQLISAGRVAHVWIGLEGEDVDSFTAQQLAIEGGALVKTVRSGSPAADAHLDPRDVIVSIEGRPVTSMAALVIDLRARRPGDRVTVGYLHEGRARTTQLTLMVRPKTL